MRRIKRHLLRRGASPHTCRESLAHAFLLDAPQLFDVMYAPMVPSILPSVKSSIEFVDSNDLAELQQQVRLAYSYTYLHPI